MKFVFWWSLIAGFLGGMLAWVQGELWQRGFFV